MTSQSRRSILRDAERRLQGAGIDNARRNAEWMMIDVLGCSLASLFANFDDSMTVEQARHFESYVSRRLRHEPLQYVLGHTEFYGLPLSVNPDVLIPRPETEQVVDVALELLASVSSPRVLDVGTGSGCIALAIKSQRRDATVMACDVSEAALGVARQNALSNQLDVQFFLLDALATSFVAQAPDGLDMLISNPPYIAENEKSSLPRDVGGYEPHLALFAPDDPLKFYKKLATDGRHLLIKGGRLVLETHAHHGEDAERVVRVAGYTSVELKRDYAGRSRIISGRI